MGALMSSVLACILWVPTLQGAPPIHQASETLIQRAVTEEGFQGVVLVAKGDQILHHTPLSTYLPGLRADLEAKLTLHLLLRQQSGLSPHLERLTPFKEEAITSADILVVINTCKLSFEPGSRFE